MGTQNKVNIWVILVVILALCNISLMAFVWLRPVAVQPSQQMERMGPPPLRLHEYLNMNEAQETQFAQLSKAHSKRIDSLKQNARTIRDAYFNALKADHKPANLDSLSSQLGIYHMYIEQATFEHFTQLRQLLDAQQQRNFDSLIMDVIHRLPEQPRRRGPGGPNGPNGQCPPPPPDGAPFPPPGERDMHAPE
jgi:hypothetical protein